MKPLVPYLPSMAELLDLEQIDRDLISAAASPRSTCLGRLRAAPASIMQCGSVHRSGPMIVMLHHMWPPRAGGARGLYAGSMHQADGTLGAMITQESLLRTVT